MSWLSRKWKHIDKTVVLLLCGFYIMFDIVLVSKVAYMQSFYRKESNFSWSDFLVYNLLIDYIIVVTYMTFIAITTKRFLNKNYSWVKIITIHTILSLFIGIVIRLVIDLHGLVTGKFNFADYDIQSSVTRFMAVIDLNFLIYFAMIFIIYTYYYLKQVKFVEKQHTKLETQLVNTRMKMLSSQLQPHFLFNTLNSIAVLTDLDAEKAKDTIADLSDFLREILYDNDSNTITLEKELRVLDYYINLLDVRFSDHLVIDKNIDQSLLNYQIPALLIQPIIENSVKHGYDYDHTDLHINIDISSQDNMMVIKIENDGANLASGQFDLMGQGVGLANISDRLSTLYGDNQTFLIKNRVNTNGVLNLIKIPLRT